MKFTKKLKGFLPTPVRTTHRINQELLNAINGIGKKIDECSMPDVIKSVKSESTATNRELLDIANTINTKLDKCLKPPETESADSRYHNQHKADAEKLIQNMSEQGKLLTPAISNKCDEYARDTFGSIIYSPWLKTYSVFAGAFKEGWIPDNYYGKIVAPKWKGTYGHIAKNKALSNRLFETDLLPDIAYSVNGLFVTPQMEPIKQIALKEYLFDICDKIVFKADNGLRGKSVFVFNAANFPDSSFVFQNGVFQRYIIQHPFFDAFNSHSVATIRVTTVVDDNLDISCRAAYLRLAREMDTHVKSATELIISLDIETGEMNEIGYLPDLTPFTHHPDSRVAFSGQKVPKFRECVNDCIALHKKLPFPRVIGWDAIINMKEKTEIIEWNGFHNGIKFSEMIVGPCFSDLGWQHLWKAVV